LLQILRLFIKPKILKVGERIKNVDFESLEEDEEDVTEEEVTEEEDAEETTDKFETDIDDTAEIIGTD
jgi:hypothetical protein